MRRKVGYSSDSARSSCFVSMLASIAICFQDVTRLLNKNPVIKFRKDDHQSCDLHQNNLSSNSDLVSSPDDNIGNI